MATGPTVTINSLVVYPIKGARGVQLSSSKIGKTGLQYDREWALVRADGPEPCKFVSQREVAKLALVSPSLSDTAITITAPNMDAPLVVPLNYTGPVIMRKVVVWEWTGVAQDQGEEAAAWFSAYLDIPVRLVRYLGKPAGEESTRHTDPDFASGYETSLNDGFPYLLANEASLRDLGDRMLASNSAEKALVPLAMARFRPNIIVSGEGLGPWQEDKWRVWTVAPAADGSDPVVLTSVKPCGRCQVPRIDPYTGIKSQGEPTDTLATFRKGTDMGWTVKAWKHLVHFGWNLVHGPEAAGRTLSVGDVIQASVPQQTW